MRKKIGQKTVFFVTIVLVGYFIFMYLEVYVGYKLGIDKFDIVKEMMNRPIPIPVLIFESILFLISIIQCIVDRFKIKTYSFWTFIILLISMVFTWETIWKTTYLLSLGF